MSNLSLSDRLQGTHFSLVQHFLMRSSKVYGVGVFHDLLLRVSYKNSGFNLNFSFSNFKRLSADTFKKLHVSKVE